MGRIPPLTETVTITLEADMRSANKAEKSLSVSVANQKQITIVGIPESITFAVCSLSHLALFDLPQTSLRTSGDAVDFLELENPLLPAEASTGVPSVNYA